MQLFNGSPLAIKKRFLEEIRQLKQNPLDKVLVLLPSKHLETRLKSELCQKLSCLAGVNFMSLGALAKEVNQSSKKTPLPLAEDSELLNFKVKKLLNENGFKANRGLAICFKNSFRDLINAEVTPETLLSMQEDDELILEEQKIYLNRFVPLYSKFLEIQKEPHKSTYKEFLTAAKENASNNVFLNSFKQIIFYGFYDLTSLQFEFVKAVIDNYSARTQVYFPYEKHPAYTFAEPAYNTLFLPLAAKHTTLESEQNLIKTAAENIFTPEQKPARGANIKIIKVSGKGETQAAAKQILELHKNGMPYQDMSLTFRGENGFNSKILEVFKKNQIPINYSFTFPLLERPFAAFVYNLFNLAKANFAREDVCAVLNSPYFAFRQEGWLDIINRSGVEGSLTQFEDILPKINAAKAKEILDILKDIKVNLALINQEKSFAELAIEAKKFLLKFTYPSAWKEQAEIFKQIDEILDTISAYSQVTETAKEGEFLEEFFTLLKESTFNKANSAPQAVEVADIMSLRLQDFKAVIILGLNEGVLPLVPQQDPALKEVYRQSLRKPLRRALQKIGYLIHTVQNRFFEENFLFYLALSSAQNQAVLTYKTSDNDGKTLVKSVFITLLLTVLGKTEDDLKGLSRRPLERLKNDIKQEFLTKEEAADLIALVNPSKEILGALLAETTKEKTLFEQNYFDLQALSSKNSLTSFDGILTQQTAKEIYPSRFSPSSLRELFSCPLKYFFGRLICAEEDVFSRSELAANRKGTLYHELLQNYYQFLEKKTDIKNVSYTEAKNLLLQLLEEKLPEREYKEYGLYPLLWQSIKQKIKEKLFIFVEADLKQMQEKNCFPKYFEKEIFSSLNLVSGPFNLKAIADRIDETPDGKTGRVIDYKTKTKQGSITNLIFEKSNLQPPLYLEILNKEDDSCVFNEAIFAFIESDSNKHFTGLTLDKFNELRGNFEALLVFLNKIVAEGNFLIYPDQENSCKYCKFADICRKNHLPTLKRTQKSKYFKELEKFHDAA